jgi:hypothetical protein
MNTAGALNGTRFFYRVRLVIAAENNADITGKTGRNPMVAALAQV